MPKRVLKCISIKIIISENLGINVKITIYTVQSVQVLVTGREIDFESRLKLAMSSYMFCLHFA